MDRVIELRRQPDGEAFYLHFTGGLRAAKANKDAWQIEPVLIHNELLPKRWTASGVI
jgi:hypothetical protein